MNTSPSELELQEMEARVLPQLSQAHGNHGSRVGIC